MSTIYERQLHWKKASDKNTDKLKEEEERRKTAENSFQPTLIAGRTRAKRGYSKEAKLNSLIESGDNHIKRQLIGRKTKVERQDRQMWKSQKVKVSTLGNSSLHLGPVTEERPQQPDTASSEDEDLAEEEKDVLEYNEDDNILGSVAPNVRSPSSEAGGASQHDVLHACSPYDDFDKDDLPVGDGLSMLETMNLEKREWEIEKMKLENCIHIQQMELEERTLAAEEKAAVIVKEFAAAIAGYERRLGAVERSVQKELVSLRSITEALTRSVEHLSSRTNN